MTKEELRKLYDAWRIAETEFRMLGMANRNGLDAEQAFELSVSYKSACHRAAVAENAYTNAIREYSEESPC